MPAAVALFFFVLGGPLCELLFGFGNASPESARFIGTILAAFVLGLPAFTEFYVLLRGFYALEDTRTPALVNFGMSAVNVVVASLLFFLAPEPLKVPALAIGSSVSYVVSVPVMWRLLSGRLGGLAGRHVLRTATRAFMASAVAGAVMLAVALGIGRVLGEGRTACLIQVIAAGGLGLLTYLLTARTLRISEVEDLRRAVTQRVGRRAGSRG